jgi:hypothetical protein
MPKLFRSEVGHRMGSQVFPDALGWVEFCRIGAQLLRRGRAILPRDKVSKELGSMRLQTIPRDQKLLAITARRALKKSMTRGLRMAPSNSRK